MNLDEVIDFANNVNREIASYAPGIVLNPARLLVSDFVVSSLNWHAVKYGLAEFHLVPDDKRGIYAFAVRIEGNIFPPHGYIMYIGIAGRDSNRSLRERYRDYLNKKKIMKRAKIARMIGNWHRVLQFIFAPVDDSVTTEDLQLLETQLNTALIPPFSGQDIDADVRTLRRAW